MTITINADNSDTYAYPPLFADPARTRKNKLSVPQEGAREELGTRVGVAALVAIAAFGHFFRQAACSLGCVLQPDPARLIEGGECGPENRVPYLYHNTCLPIDFRLTGSLRDSDDVNVGCVLAGGSFFIADASAGSSNSRVELLQISATNAFRSFCLDQREMANGLSRCSAQFAHSSRSRYLFVNNKYNIACSVVQLMHDTQGGIIRSLRICRLSVWGDCDAFDRIQTCRQMVEQAPCPTQAELSTPTEFPTMPTPCPTLVELLNSSVSTSKASDMVTTTPQEGACASPSLPAGALVATGVIAGLVFGGVLCLIGYGIRKCCLSRRPLVSEGASQSNIREAENIYAVLNREDGMQKQRSAVPDSRASMRDLERLATATTPKAYEMIQREDGTQAKYDLIPGRQISRRGTNELAQVTTPIEQAEQYKINAKYEGIKPLDSLS